MASTANVGAYQLNNPVGAYAPIAGTTLTIATSESLQTSEVIILPGSSSTLTISNTTQLQESTSVATVIKYLLVLSNNEQVQSSTSTNLTNIIGLLRVSFKLR